MKRTAKEFWNWFRDNSNTYLDIGTMEDNAKETLFKDLQTKLQQYSDQLYFQIGGMPGQSQELIITAEGNTKLFPKVEELINSAPIIDHWTFIAFIQPDELDPLLKIEFEDVELHPNEIWFLPLNSKNDPQSIGIKVCMPNYRSLKESEWFESSVYKLLDSLLGEKSFALDLDFIDYDELPPDPAGNGLIELHELRRYIVWKKSKLNRS